MSKRLFILGIIVVVFSSMCFPAHWILESNNGKLPVHLQTLVNEAGGTLVNSIHDVGFAVAEFASREEAEIMAGHNFTVMPDVSLNWLPGIESEEHIGSNEPFYPYQWYLPQVGADLAWQSGYTGTGARVAIVDTGIWYYHPDFEGNLDLPAGASFVPDTTILDDNGHGTHVAGIVAAADNDFGTIGVAPQAKLIPVKVLAGNGSGNISWVTAGIIHAANQDVDVINLSLGGMLRKSGYLPYYTASDVANIVNMYRKVLSYANSKGALVVHSAGGGSLDLDHDGNLMVIPAQAKEANGIVVSATGPIALQNFDRLASYSNYGVSTIDVAAPGGDYMNYPNPNWQLDMMLSTAPGPLPGTYGWRWMSGTSMAAPMVSGAAALVVSKYGHMGAAQLKQKIIQSADDLGKPGADPIYGKGRINAYEAVR